MKRHLLSFTVHVETVRGDDMEFLIARSYPVQREFGLLTSLSHESALDSSLRHQNASNIIVGDLSVSQSASKLSLEAS